MNKIIVLIITVGVALSVGLAVLYALNTNGKESPRESSAQKETSLVEESMQQTEETTPVSQEIASETKELYVAETTSVAEAFSETEKKDFVENMRIAASVSQMIVVSAQGSSAVISMHEKSVDGSWKEILSTNGWVGENGVGQASEYDTKTPSGIYSLSFAFGIKEKPVTELFYTKVDDSYYWVDDVDSSFYNKFVSLNEVVKDWDSAEHIIECGKAYNYVIPIDYNLERVPGNGSAMFLHVSTGEPTGGCVSVPESDMLFILQNIHSGCIILIDRQENILNY
ncbi:L,D-transpeptidase family protein [Parasporobacterium paucivorans]|uniref:L,D-peptidoglycan transpeptidase YkuD, ErfK/YbiS/YcfS/YnhG family n=1 Tax=Parasporobacterium paucivorans DSM 15970 TaxID=1122934 RepID=A0A1M6DLK8_9FIRM|nr:L,D-transpeptidase family protein [Parasporobacterium paucivorans]SHI73878.1 L,D-peptidoglycan transpeptidase YkuD, ErfK/YbiS/YcfS/YnhG family [Parasporobacterium paucivorans DSM 15970]